MNLKEECEVVGVLKAVMRKHNRLILTFQMKKEIEIYPEADLEKELKEFVGHMIGIFNLDGKYIVRGVKTNGK